MLIYLLLKVEKSMDANGTICVSIYTGFVKVAASTALILDIAIIRRQ